MPLLTTAELAGMRNEVVATQLDMRCTIQRSTTGAVDKHGQPSTSWAALLTNLACHYWEDDEAELVGTVNATITRERMVLPALSAVKTGDRVTTVTGVDGAELLAEPLDVEEVLYRELDVVLVVKAVG